jgi:hypothetical protein
MTRDDERKDETTSNQKDGARHEATESNFFKKLEN